MVRQQFLTEIFIGRCHDWFVQAFRDSERTFAGRGPRRICWLTLAALRIESWSAIDCRFAVARSLMIWLSGAYRDELSSGRSFDPVNFTAKIAEFIKEPLLSVLGEGVTIRADENKFFPLFFIAYAVNLLVFL